MLRARSDATPFPSPLVPAPDVALGGLRRGPGLGARPDHTRWPAAWGGLLSERCPALGRPRQCVDSRAVEGGPLRRNRRPPMNVIESQHADELNPALLLPVAMLGAAGISPRRSSSGTRNRSVLGRSHLAGSQQMHAPRRRASNRFGLLPSTSSSTRRSSGQRSPGGRRTVEFASDWPATSRCFPASGNASTRKLLLLLLLVRRGRATCRPSGAPISGRTLVPVDVTVPAARRDVLEALISRARIRAGLASASAGAD